MKRLAFIGLAGLVWSSDAAAGTDFGIRTVGPSTNVEIAPAPAPAYSAVDIHRAVSIGSQFGMVTSTRRSVQHNRRVGGVPNSYHLSGRAIDIARRRGVTHSQIAQAYRQAGMQLIESLDEGDHSHFAFGAGRLATTVRKAQYAQSSATNWGVVLAP